jgi:hypothetical protein
LLRPVNSSLGAVKGITSISSRHVCKDTRPLYAGLGYCVLQTQ